jgi:hypothetical protein
MGRRDRGPMISQDSGPVCNSVNDFGHWGWVTGNKSREKDPADPDDGSCSKKGCKGTPSSGDAFCEKHMGARGV